MAEKAVELTSHRDAAVFSALAAAYAETGRYEEAIRVAEQALVLASASGSQPLVNEIQRCIACYRGNRPFRQAAAHLGPANP